MTILVKKAGTLYTAETTPPHGGNAPWSSLEPMSRLALVQLLLSRGATRPTLEMPSMKPIQSGSCENKWTERAVPPNAETGACGGVPGARAEVTSTRRRDSEGGLDGL